MDKIKKNVKKEIDSFAITNSNVMDTITNSEPYYSLDDCETVDEIIEYLDDYQFNIENAKQSLQDFNDILEDLIRQLEMKHG